MADSSGPLSLYIHIPWCTRKCPYCDFNSHENFHESDVSFYIDKLIDDLKHDLGEYQINRSLKSIFIGGGTPSLFKPESINRLLEQIDTLINFENHIEITMEANPASSQSRYFQELAQTRVNRVSLGVQSFEPDKLKALGRLHSSEEAKLSLEKIGKYFENFNIDLMFGLPGQSIDQGLKDLEIALRFNPPHLSWYQLTIEPNTVFYRNTPVLPEQDSTFELQSLGIDYLAREGLFNYEISAFSKADAECQHNLNYWQFGDYLGIGAGAHGKISRLEDSRLKIERYSKTRQPQDYLKKTGSAFIASKHIVPESELALEFLMNQLRLDRPFPANLFEQCTGLSSQILSNFLEKARQKGLLTFEAGIIEKTSLGKLHLDTLLTLI